MVSALLISAVSAAVPSAASRGPSAIARSMCAISRAWAASASRLTRSSEAAGMPEGSPRIPSASAAATGALSRSGEVRTAGGVPLLLRGVLPVVTGEIQPGHVQQRVAPVHLQVAERDPGGVLERGQVRLVVRVVEPRARGRGHPGQTCPDPVPGQILDLAVVLVPSAELAHLGDVEIADGAKPGG